MCTYWHRNTQPALKTQVAVCARVRVGVRGGVDEWVFAWARACVCGGSSWWIWSGFSTCTMDSAFSNAVFSSGRLTTNGSFSRDGTHSAVASYKPPMLVTWARFPVCALLQRYAFPGISRYPHNAAAFAADLSSGEDVGASSALPACSCTRSCLRDER